ncbi:uncharacterized protein SCHCODRAFT_02620197 [Schizophyllum commune H4-8]|uniref:uncharacterized protein n=1 Tax=Schizophyllum commune (strain H4-8 / FGSC 9210) TaxID=578458 RepID=UPI00215ECEB9|nr:uncharacterized protein SCHCODRAFT_02620197 [Schizophyllum commune H4-8]KAI5895723.1 hypothetical protein SCHCODRAFT_02620197 [Schizophyllum commune H4-8]
MRARPAAHGFFLVDKMPRLRDGFTPGTIKSLANIRQICMLTPSYGTRLDISSQASWTSDNVLDECDRFLLNNFQSMYTYKTLW